MRLAVFLIIAGLAWIAWVSSAMWLEKQQENLVTSTAETV